MLTLARMWFKFADVKQLTLSSIFITMQAANALKNILKLDTSQYIYCNNICQYLWYFASSVNNKTHLKYIVPVTWANVATPDL